MTISLPVIRSGFILYSLLSGGTTYQRWDVWGLTSSRPEMGPLCFGSFRLNVVLPFSTLWTFIVVHVDRHCGMV